ncbi:hypothetical protein J1605_005475 [Eschrichtius robustus]|uniref:Neural cell adhesion molecule L1-like protein n=1 Tax=Eschrichtius robustus TaxID=9764 RepID=A0AB34H8W1_ESCRO|nr:hypothetical protein J1605_005475 [Eschrichtius robustus]
MEMVKFSWSKDDKPFDLSDPRIIVSNNSGTFRIPNEGHISHFQGKYRCFASNKLGIAMSEEMEFIVPNVPKFPKEKIDPLEVEEGDPIVLPCNPPKGLPPLHIYWMNIELEHIEQDERVYMSQKGDLYFANVEEKDSRNDYCCFAAFPRLRTIVQKMPMKLTVNSLKHANDSSSSTEIGSKANSIKQRKPRLLLPSPENGSESSVTILKGDTLLLECFAEGLPTPQVDWSKMGGDLPKGRETKENYGKTLKIENVSYRDKGNYRCTASNFLGSAIHDFHVIVEEPPRWTKKPQSGVYSTGSSGILLCESEGEPEPTIKWRVNGFPIERNPFSGDVISPREISFTNLQPNHTAVYQCEASNVHGTILANANIDVVDVRPLIQTADEENYATVVGYSAFLHCEFFASPEAIVSWIIIDGANLTISNVTVEDQGVYSCSAHTALDSTAAMTQVTVLDVPDPPENLHLSERQNRSVRLTWEAGDDHNSNISAPDKNPQNIRVQASQPKEMIIKWEPLKPMEQNGPGLEYRVTWKPQGVPVEWEEETVTNHTLRVMTSAVYAPYDVQVQAVNHLGSGPEPQSVILYSGEDLPEKPTFLKVIKVDKDTATLSWGLPKKLNGNLTGYLLQYQIINDTYEIGELNDINITTPSKPSWRLSNLNATTKYKFYLRACTSKGCGKPITEESSTLGEGRKYAGLYDDISTQGWFIGLMCAIALLTLILLTVCFVKRNKGGKYSVKEKEDLHPDPEVQSVKDETFGEYSDSDEKPLKGSLRSLNRDMQATESADSLVEYGEGDHGLFSEDGSFIGAYAGSKEKGSAESNGSSTAPFPLRA